MRERTTTLTVVTEKTTFRVLVNEKEITLVVEVFRKTKRDRVGGILNFYCENLKENVLVGTDDVKYLSWETVEEN